MTAATVLCIVGDSRSGSTLLQYLAATQWGVATAGELRRLPQLIRDRKACSCGAPVADCAYWRVVLEHAGIAPAALHAPPGGWHQRRGELAGAATLAGVPRRLARLAAPDAAALADQYATLHGALAGVSGARVVVDSSKDIGQALVLALQARLAVRPVFLFRDGRAVIHSQVRRTGIDVGLAVRHWVRLTKSMLLMRRIAGARGVTVMYEDLCARPQAALTALLAPFGVEVQLRDPPPPSEPMHFLGGSPGFTVTSVELLAPDEGWRTSAPPALLGTFEALAGPLNRRLGYGA